VDSSNKQNDNEFSTSSKKRKLDEASFKNSDETDDEDVKVMKLDQKSSSKQACKYGANCYRKNDDHLKEFSHPVDSNGKKSKILKKTF
jgi:hypothetical protein